jgi:transcriptional regulator with XRE-family HTH domain
MDIDTLLAARVRGLRKARGATLDLLAQRSGVSRSMISLIERGETSPTAAVLSKLASALDVPLATLFDAVPADTPSPLARHSEQAAGPTLAAATNAATSRRPAWGHRWNWWK